MTHVVNVAEDYTPYPLGRFRAAWPFSGQQFREDFMEPTLRRGEKLTVNLKGVKGLAPSFLEEAFGGLATAGFTIDELKSLLTIVADDVSRVQEVWLYITSAEGASAH